MNAQTELFGSDELPPYQVFWKMNPTFAPPVRNSVASYEPKARKSDPSTSHEAAVAVKPGNGALIEAIRQAVARWHSPATAFDIADLVGCAFPGRWSEASIRTAISRASLRAVDTDGRSPRGQRCIRYSL